MPTQIRPTLLDMFPPPPWFGPYALQSWLKGDLIYKAELTTPEGIYLIREHGSRIYLTSREIQEGEASLVAIGGLQKGHYVLYEVTGMIHFYIGKASPLFPGDAYIYYDIRKSSARISDTVVSPDLRRKGFGSLMARLLEDRVRIYGVNRIEGAATIEGKLFWPKLGYTISNSHMEKRL